MRISSKINVSGCLVVVFLLILKLCDAVELTFELPDNAKECFYQEIQKNQTANLEFQVRTRKTRNFPQIL